MADPLKCEYCLFGGRVQTEGVEFESSRTMYHHAPCEHEDCLANPELRQACFEAADDPNKPLALCRPCAAEYHENWDHQWAEYNAGLL